MGAMKLIEAFSTQVSVDWSPRKTVTKTGREQITDGSALSFICSTRWVSYPTDHFLGDNFLGLEETGICNFFLLSFILPLCSLPKF